MNAEKARLRRALELIRAQADERCPDAGARLVATFPEELVPAAGAVVSGYLKFHSEIDPARLLEALAARGATIALPRTPPKGADAPLTFHRVDREDVLRRSAFGVLEPEASCPTVEPDLLLVPLLGFDRAGGRLGYGQGHYDRTLAGLRMKKRIVAVGLAFAEQEAPAIPRDAHDALLDWIVTPSFAVRIV